MTALVTSCAVTAFLLAGCTIDDPPLSATLDRPYFDCRVQPVLTKSCGALACHGASERYFRVFARNRARLGLDTPADEMLRNTLLLPAERDHNFAAALALVDPSDVRRSELLQKPLAEAAGGWFHRGAELYRGGDVFASLDDPDYKVLAAWVAGAEEDPTCQEPGSSLSTP